jgi:hypothetical protein
MCLSPNAARPWAVALRVLLLAGCAMSAVSPFGCGPSDGIKRVVISGKVSYQGQPVTDGLIVFVPAKGTKGPTASATIRDGTYTVVAAGGVPTGTHCVEIQAYRPVAAPPNRPASRQDMAAKQQYLPEQYNRQSTLEATVDAKGGNTQDFDLK